MSGGAVIDGPALADDTAAVGILGAPGVEVWQASLDAQSAETVDRLRALLSPDELKRAAGFHFERDHRRFVVARGVLRTLLGEYLARDPRELTFAYGEQGKPTLENEGGHPPLAFNVAHAEGLALFAFTRTGDVGIDVERVRPIPEWEEIAAVHFSVHEIARLATYLPSQREQEFFKAWARHEAILKAHGAGIGGELSPEFTSHFRLHTWEPAPGFVGALAVNRNLPELTLRTWPVPNVDFSAPPADCRVQLNFLSESSPNLP